MKTIKTTVVAVTLLASLGGIQTASAEVSANVALTSNYIFRGVTQNNEDPALQGGFDWEDKSGFYLGVWGSSVDFGGDESTELDFYGGYGFDLAPGFSADIGLTLFKFFGGDSASDSDVEEAHLGLSYAGFDLYYYLGLSDFDSDTIELSYGFDITSDIGVTLTVGDFEDVSDFYYSAGVSGPLGYGVDWDLTVADADEGNDSTQVAFSISKSL